MASFGKQSDSRNPYGFKNKASDQRLKSDMYSHLYKSEPLSLENQNLKLSLPKKPSPVMAVHLNLTSENTEAEPPIPKGNSAYAKAKKAEYTDKDLAKAEKYYRMAIMNGERVESALKDLATVLHQQGKTVEACKFLEENRHRIKRNRAKYDNLLSNLKKQITPSGNFLNRTLTIFNVDDKMDGVFVTGLFNKNTRINDIEFISGDSVIQIVNNYESPDAPALITKRACLIHFSSNSAARKTLETLKNPNEFEFWWMNTDHVLICKAEVYLKSDNLSETESIYTNNSSTQNTSFYGSGSLDYSPAHSRSNYPSIENIENSELGNSARSRQSSVSSDDESPCWRNMVLFLNEQDQVPWTDDHFEFENYKSYTSFKSIPDISETYTQSRIISRRPSRFLQEHANENPNSWQAKALISSGQKIPKEKGKKSSLWRQVLSKEKKVKLSIEEDPHYVQRLLHKLVSQRDFFP